MTGMHEYGLLRLKGTENISVEFYVRNLVKEK